MLPKALPYQLKVRDHLKSHPSLWEFFSATPAPEGQNGELETADRIITAITEYTDKGTPHWQTARLFRIYSDLYCDRCSGEVMCGDEDPGHPLRVRALRLWQEQGETAEPVIIRMVEGTPELGCLDLFGQARIRELTRLLIREFLRPEGMRTAQAVDLALDYFPDLSWEEGEWQPESLAEEHGSIRDYFAFVLVDLVLADPIVKEQAFERASTFAGRLGIADSFGHLYNSSYGKPNQGPL